MRFAEAGIADLLTEVDTLLIIPNQNLFRVANEKTTFTDAFALADQVLYSGVACISDLIVKEGLINLDFADVLSIMREKGRAMMGRAEASGEGRVLAAAVAAMSNPLIEDPSIKRASGLIISITGGKDMSLYEVDEAVTRIREEADPDANIIVGASFDETMEGSVRVAVVATGIDNVDAARAAQMGETLTALAGRLNDDALRASELGASELADDRFGYAPQAAQRAPLPRVESPPLRPAPRPLEATRASEMARARELARVSEAARAQEGRSARPIADNARHATPQGLEAYRPRANMRSATHVPSAIEDDILETPAFLRRPAS
jgi:cell division protein FtsZ